MYIMLGSRPDIALAMQQVSKYLNNPGKSHWGAVKRIMRYLQGTKDYGIVFKGGDDTLSMYTDSDYANDPDTARSTSGYVSFLGSSIVSWSCRVQRLVAQSSTEAEYIALAHAGREALYLRESLKELYLPQKTTKIFEDSESTKNIADNPVHHARTKHIEVRYHFIRKRIQMKHLEVAPIDSDDNVADVYPSQRCLSLGSGTNSVCTNSFHPKQVNEESANHGGLYLSGCQHVIMHQEFFFDDPE